MATSTFHYTSHNHTCRVFRCLRVLECTCLPMWQGQQVPALLWEVGLCHPKASGMLQTQENALPRQDRCANASSVSRPFYSLTGKTAKTHFQIGNWINVKNIYTCISTIYHTALIKSGFSGCKCLCSIWKCAYFSDAQICKRIEWYRKIIWTHIRDSQRENVLEIIKSSFTQHKQTGVFLP